MVLQPNPKNGVLDGLSQNYKVSSPLGSVQSNIVFDDRNTMPKEMMMEATLEAFDFNYDIFEVYFSNKFIRIVKTIQNIYFLQEFKHQFFRLALKGQDLNQQSMVFLGIRALSLNQSPDS